MRFSREQLVWKALLALDEIVQQCGKSPVPKSLMLRFTLAYLYVAAGAQPSTKWLFESFWKTATQPAPTVEVGEFLNSYCRLRDATTAMNGICWALGMEPTVSLYQAMAEARTKQ